MIEIRHLTKKYGENVAVNDLNLTLEPGNIYGFLGPNGAGKTTTMNIITGYIGATSGEVIINGYDINKEPEKAKQCMGYLPELPPVYGDMRVTEYLDFVAELKQLNRHTRTADIQQSMDLTKLQSVKDRLIRNLSKGYRQRVGLAQALMGMPEIIILDEPTVGLDPKQIIEIRDLIRSLKDNHTVILSSHILQEISAVCDHVFIISNGNLVASDTMENLEEKMSGAQQVAVTLRTTEALAGSLVKLAGVKSADVLEVKWPKRETQDPGPEPAEENLSEDTAESSDAAASMSDEGLPENIVTDAVVKTPEDAESVSDDAVKSAEKTEDAVESEKDTESAVENITEENTEVVTPDMPTNAILDIEELLPENPEIRLEITAKPGMDVREDIFLYCAENDMVLLEMTSITKSLEDVFLELTEEREEA
ncbi:MAG: ATP-binding cassette domain-containing protein [Clostridiales bacterium]|nr:ATP-binding cassette domain-containing protein [Clostridiales bacterium]